MLIIAFRKQTTMKIAKLVEKHLNFIN